MMGRNGWLVCGILIFGWSLGSGCKEGDKSPSQAAKALEPVRCEAEVTPETLAFIGDVPVTLLDVDLSDVDMSIKQQAFEVQGRFLEVREALLNNHLFHVLTEKEAKSKGMTRDELVKKEVTDKMAKVSEASVQAYYDDIAGQRKQAGRSTPPFADVADQVRQHLGTENQGKRQEVYFAELRKKYDVKYVEAASVLSKPRYKVAAGQLPVKGDDKAPVTIVEFSHYKCPHCAKGAETLNQVAQTYPGLVKMYFRDFPLGQDMASKAPAIAARCASAQGKFWEYHDVLFKNQRQLAQEQLLEYAKGLKLDMGSFEKCLQDPEIVKHIDEDQAAGQSLGVRGTPAFFINGVMLGGAIPFDQFKSVIDEELKLAGVKIPAKKVMP